MNLGDPELEFIDPTPNVHLLFIHFDKLFFWAKLASRAVVRWSKRMYSCAGICSYDRGGLCDIALSEPLLKLRPRKDLVETLLHEMIHAFLFITNRDRDRDGHGPNFQAHMHRINRSAGLNISIYHSFHEEVQLYQTHWWRCNGPCQTRRPHFGIVRRTANRAPGPSDFWWKNHLKHCGGTFVKIKEPEKQENKQKSTKSNGDITKYIDNNKTDNEKNMGNRKNIGKGTKAVLKDSNIIKTINPIKNNNNTIVVSKKNVVFNPQPNKPTIFTGSGHILNASKSPTSKNVVETVRNIWANKQLSPVSMQSVKNNNRNSLVNLNKTKAEENNSSPPKKILKIDDYFKNNAKTVLKDIYGKDFDIKEVKTNKEKRLSVVSVETTLVSCPVCNTNVVNTDINKHLDECLNKEVVEELSKELGNELVSYTASTSKKPNPPLDKSLSKDTALCNKLHSSDISKPNKPIIIEKEENIKPESTIKVEPGTSKESTKCPCCGSSVEKSIEDHLDECLAFFDNNTTIPEEGKSSILNETIVIDDDEDEFDETQTFNATGTKLPCPCCMKMIEGAEMNNHLDICLN